VNSREATSKNNPPHPLLLWQGEGGALTVRPTAEIPSVNPGPLAAPAIPRVPPSRVCAHAPGTSGSPHPGRPAAPLWGSCEAAGVSPSHTLLVLLWVRDLLTPSVQLKSFSQMWQCPCYVW